MRFKISILFRYYNCIYMKSRQKDIRFKDEYCQKIPVIMRFQSLIFTKQVFNQLFSLLLNVTCVSDMNKQQAANKKGYFDYGVII